MKFVRQGISTATLGAIAVVAIIVVGAGAYLAASGSSKTSTVVSVSTVTGAPSTVTTSSVVTSVVTQSGTTATVVSTLGGTTSTVTQTTTAVSTSVSTAVSTLTSTTTSVSTQTTVATPVLPATLTNPTGGLSETGSSLLYPLINFWATAFTQQYSGVQVNTASSSSGTGQSSVEAGTVNMGASDVSLTAAQQTAYPTILNIPVAIASQCVNYNLPMIPAADHLNMTGNVLAGIYNGTITQWNNKNIVALQSASVGALLPAQGIIPFHRSDNSGDTGIFTQYLADTSSDWALHYGTATTISWPNVPAAQGESGNSGMEAAVEANEYGIAYIGISYQSELASAGIGCMALQNAAGNFEPLTQTTVSAAAAAMAPNTPPNEKISLVYAPGTNSYPIITYEYVMVSQSQSSVALQQAIQTFLWWATLPNDGQSANYLNSPSTPTFGALGFVALPPAVAQLSWAQINSITG